MNKENIINNSGINSKNCMNKSKTELKELADSLNIIYNVKTTKEQLCSSIFGDKFSTPKRGTREDVNKLQPSGIPSDDIHILDALYNRCSFFTLDRLKEIAKIYDIQYSGTRQMLCNRLINHITNNSEKVNKNDYKVSIEPFKPYKCHPGNVRYTKNDLKELAQKYNVEYTDDKRDVCKKLFEVHNKLIKKSDKETPEKKEKIKKNNS